MSDTATNDVIDSYADTIRQAGVQRHQLRMRGSGSKDFYGGSLSGKVLDTRRYSGIVSYEPQELVLTARAGTPLAEIEKLLSENGQMLPFEPPHFGAGATLGGCVATGLSGPRRAYQGAARDYVLGVRMLDGRGDMLTFGGQVMKNVAGYDVSRLQAGAMGTLGLLLEISLKILPSPATETTLRFDLDQAQALEMMNRWAGISLPLSGSCYHEQVLTVRLSGVEKAVQAAKISMGGEVAEQGMKFWCDLREQRDVFFQAAQPLWRISLPSTAPPLSFKESGAAKQLIEWGGALRWCSTEVDAQTVRSIAVAADGQATLFRGGDKAAGVFHFLPEPLMKIHRNLKQSFDPDGIFNYGRLYDF